MKARYKPQSLPGKLGWVIEECGELQAAIGKTLRHGLDSYNPELPAYERETNRDWILREIKDVEAALKLLKEAL